MAEIKNPKLDVLRFKKDKMPANLCYFAIILDVLYFILVYKINNDYFYTPIVGVSIVINLFFMLAAFLCSEEVKNYHGKFGILMIVVGVIEILRVLYYPMQCSANGVMTDAQFIRSIIYLVGAGALLIVGGAMSMMNSKKLENYKKSIGEN